MPKDQTDNPARLAAFAKACRANQSKWRDFAHGMQPDKGLLLCHAKEEFRRSQRPARVTKDTLQDLKISGLVREVGELRSLVDMLLVLVDPEDVQAALRLREITPSFDELADLADSTTPPPELFGKE